MLVHCSPCIGKIFVKFVIDQRFMEKKIKKLFLMEPLLHSTLCLSVANVVSNIFIEKKSSILHSHIFKFYQLDVFLSVFKSWIRNANVRVVFFRLLKKPKFLIARNEGMGTAKKFVNDAPCWFERKGFWLEERGKEEKSRQKSFLKTVMSPLSEKGFEWLFHNLIVQPSGGLLRTGVTEKGWAWCDALVLMDQFVNFSH